MEQNARTGWIDIAKGIGILLVVFGHAEVGGTKLIYSFHMPFFFIISGILYKESKAIVLYAKKIVTRYIIPYFVLCFINLLITVAKERDLSIVEKYIVGILYSRGSTEWMPNCSPLWFLTCISVALFSFNIIQKYCKRSKARFGIIIICALMSYLLDILNAPKLVWNIDTALMALPFLEIGRLLYVTRDKIKSLLVTKCRVCLLGLMGIGVLSAYCNDIEPMVNFDSNEYGNLFYMFVAAICISISLLAIIYIVDVNLSKKIRKVIEFYGQHTLFIMGFDYFSGSVAWLLLDMMNLNSNLIVFIIKILILTVGVYIWTYIVNRIPSSKLQAILRF